MVIRTTPSGYKVEERGADKALYLIDEHDVWTLAGAVIYKDGARIALGQTNAGLFKVDIIEDDNESEWGQGATIEEAMRYAIGARYGDNTDPESGEYCSASEVVAIRVFPDRDYWNVDGIAADGRYTESCKTTEPPDKGMPRPTVDELIDWFREDHELGLEVPVIHTRHTVGNVRQPLPDLVPRSAVRQQRIIDSICGEVYAQLSELSDDTGALIESEEDSVLADDLRTSLRAAVDQRISDWRIDHDVPALSGPCKKCGSPLANGFCIDETCPFSERRQDATYTEG